MKKILFLAALFLVFLSSLSLISCSKNDPVTPKSKVFYDYFDTVTTVYDYTGGSEEDFNRVLLTVRDELSMLHKNFDIYNEYADVVSLAEVNAKAAISPIKVDRRIIDLLLYSKEIHELTGGECNVAFGSVLSIWHEYREAGKSLPPIDALSSASEHTDINSLIIDEENSTVFFSDPRLKLDVGAVAKGYAEEKIALMLEDMGITSYVLDFGGNLRAIGTKVDGSGWSTGIKNPDVFSDKRYIHTLTLSDEALATSGVYERFYTVSGVRYHHIIDKDTLMPSDRYLSVSVKSQSAALSDSLSTALFNMEREEIEELVFRDGTLTVVLVLGDGEVVVIE